MLLNIRELTDGDILPTKKKTAQMMSNTMENGAKNITGYLCNKFFYNTSNKNKCSTISL